MTDAAEEAAKGPAIEGTRSASRPIDFGWLRPDLTIDGVAAVMTTRLGGVSDGPWTAMNLGSNTGDDPAHVSANRAAFHTSIGAEPVFMQQVHGIRVLELGNATPDDSGTPPHQADACVTTQPGIACTVLVADCLPVLFAARGKGSHASAVGAAHAGWRGLAAGVVEATLAKVCGAAGCDPLDVHVWLGACIGPEHFQVGKDVLEAFGAKPDDSATQARFRQDGAGKWLADLPGLARDRLTAAGVRQIGGGAWCTVGDASRFFSYRRDGVTGRMAASIWIDA